PKWDWHLSKPVQRSGRTSSTASGARVLLNVSDVAHHIRIAAIHTSFNFGPPVSDSDVAQEPRAQAELAPNCSADQDADHPAAQPLHLLGRELRTPEHARGIRLECPPEGHELVFFNKFDPQRYGGRI